MNALTFLHDKKITLAEQVRRTNEYRRHAKKRNPNDVIEDRIATKADGRLSKIKKLARQIRQRFGC